MFRKNFVLSTFATRCFSKVILMAISFVFSCCIPRLSSSKKIDALVYEYDNGLPNMSIAGRDPGDIGRRGSVFFVKFENDSSLYTVKTRWDGYREMKEYNRNDENILVENQRIDKGLINSLNRGADMMEKYGLDNYRKNDSLCFIQFLDVDTPLLSQMKNAQERRVYILCHTEKESTSSILKERRFEEIQPGWYRLITQTTDNQILAKTLF